jgi:predicted secreted hydrolase
MKNSPVPGGWTRRQWLTAFAVARPGYRYEFPRDHGPHTEFQTEWWYYTGNLFTANANRRFGFELTFFRQRLEAAPRGQGTWTADPVWLAHLALSDIGGGRFYHAERVNRTGPGLAGCDEGGRVWNGNWTAAPNGELRGVADEFQLSLSLDSRKAAVIHGAGGVSQKAAGVGRASHYLSQTRIAAKGTVALRGERFSVAGQGWMDHEFFTHQLEPNQTGWDWLSIQLDDQTELMLFRLRRRDGTLDPYSAGTFVDAQGRARQVTADQFRLTPGGLWRSPATQALYPLSWRIEIPVLDIDLRAATPLQNQELVSRSRYSPSYWEGAMDFRGRRAGKAIAGVGYLEMTGYDKPVVF